MRYLKSNFFSIVFLTFSLLPQVGVSQILPSDNWYNGFVVLKKGDTLEGTLKYNLDVNTVILKNPSGTSTIGANNIFLFQIADNEDKLKTFYSLPYEVSARYKRDILFELMYEAPMTLMAREKISRETISTQDRYNPYNTNPLFYTVEKLDYDFYFLDQEGLMIEFRDRSRKNLVKMLGFDKKAMDLYIRKNKLSIDKPAHLIKIAAYYNAIRYGSTSLEK